jgi:hypothetical protein
MPYEYTPSGNRFTIEQVEDKISSVDGVEVVDDGALTFVMEDEETVQLVAEIIASQERDAANKRMYDNAKQFYEMSEGIQNLIY